MLNIRLALLLIICCVAQRNSSAVDLVHYQELDFGDVPVGEHVTRTIDVQVDFANRRVMVSNSYGSVTGRPVADNLHAFGVTGFPKQNTAITGGGTITITVECHLLFNGPAQAFYVFSLYYRLEGENHFSTTYFTFKVHGTSQSELEIQRANFVDRKTLAIQCSRKFGGISGQCTATVEIGGLSYEFPPQDRSDTFGLDDTDPLLLDFESAEIPRFTSFTTINLHIRAVVDGSRQDVQTEDSIGVPLPVITLTGLTDNRVLNESDWEASILLNASGRLFKSRNLLGEGYRLRKSRFPNSSLSSAYGTVETLAYRVNSATSTDFRLCVGPFINTAATMLAETYADKVDLIGYSTGGVIARVLVAENLLSPAGGNLVNKVVTLGSPHSGTAWAHYSEAYFGVRRKNLTPLYPWWRNGSLAPYTLFPPGVSAAVANPQLSYISGLGVKPYSFPETVTMYLYACGTIDDFWQLTTFGDYGLPGALAFVTQTPILKPKWLSTLNRNGSLDGVGQGVNALVPGYLGITIGGDGFITEDSQLGRLSVPPDTTGSVVDLPAFIPGLKRGTILRRHLNSVSHVDFFENNGASAAIANWIVADLSD